jgi:ketosteroid isomerase-like protein
MIEVAADNERLLRSGYAAFASGDLATIERMFHPGVIWHAQRLGQLGGDHIGWPAVADFFGRSMQLTRGSFHISVTVCEVTSCGLESGHPRRSGRRCAVWSPGLRHRLGVWRRGR